MTDYWPHLHNPTRGGSIAALIADDILDAHILDLNCGWAPCIEHMDGRYATYYGNDVQKEFIDDLNSKGYKSAVFEFKKDEDVKRDNVDVLIFLGACGQVLHPDSAHIESHHDYQSFLRIANTNHPRTCVLESPQEVFDLLDKEKIIFDMESAGYKKLEQHVVSIGDNKYEKRIVWIWRK